MDNLLNILSRNIGPVATAFAGEEIVKWAVMNIVSQDENGDLFVSLYDLADALAIDLDRIYANLEGVDQ